ncbi:MAG TPA: sugar ABC transporter permease [Thermoanaerobaculia bacterium]|nr:sugar ABC transporter permease [Thermoanaerobaculia bacterium]
MREGLRNEARAAALFLAPALAVIFLLFLLPAVASLFLSVTDFDIYALADYRNVRFVGLRNYQQLLGDAVFWKAMRNTLYFAFAGGPLTVFAALGSAMLVNAKLTRWKSLFRTIYFAPVVTSLVAVSIVFRYFFHVRVGLLNQFMELIGLAPVDWLGEPKWAMPSIILLAVWKNFGYSMIIFVAGLQSIPEEMYEAARIDGAGPVQQFRHVTIPMLAPTFLFVGIVTAVGYLQLFAEPYVMTPDGGPLKSTLSVVMMMYEQGFRWWSLGFAAAIAFILFIVIGIATVIQFRLQTSRERASAVAARTATMVGGEE